MTADSKSKAAELAVSLGLKTAANVAPPADPPDTTPKGKPLRWTAARRFVFNTLEPAALSLVASDGPISVTLWDAGGGPRKRYGHNRGVWPVRVEKGAAWGDHATRKWDRNPFFFLGTQARMWFRTEQARDQVAASIVDLIAARAEADGALERLEHGFQDLGADLDLEFFEIEMHDVAKRLGVLAWDDNGLVAWIDQLWARANEGKPGGGNDRRPRGSLIERLAMKDVEALAASENGGR
jgi:hypothetical protein